MVGKVVIHCPLREPPGHFVYARPQIGKRGREDLQRCLDNSIVPPSDKEGKLDVSMKELLTEYRHPCHLPESDRKINMFQPVEGSGDQTGQLVGSILASRQAEGQHRGRKSVVIGG